ncbi:hypothetical protein AB9K41_26225 [Cribrihabitans sp. XS_ASV171]
MPSRIAIVAAVTLVLAVPVGRAEVTPDGVDRAEAQGQTVQSRAGKYSGPRGGAR